MVSRRVVVGAGAAVVAAGAGLHLAGRDDDLLRAVGARPRPVPDPADTALLRTALSEQETLRATLEAVAADDGDLDVEDLVAVMDRQVTTLGGPSSTPPAASPDVDAAGLAERLAQVARSRERDALAAVSPDLAQVLASLAAGLAQTARTLGRRA